MTTRITTTMPEVFIVASENRLFELSEQAILCFAQAERYASWGYGALFEIYEDTLWRAEAISWEGWLRDFVQECRNRDISIVSVETLQQRSRDYVRLVVGAGVAVETVLSLPARVANSISKLGVWPRQGASDYDTSEEGILQALAPCVRENAIERYGLLGDVSDTEVLREVVFRLAGMPSAGAGMEEINSLLRPDQNYSEFFFFVSVQNRRIQTRVSMTTYREGGPALAWDGGLDQDNVPEAVLVEYARRLGTHLSA